MTQPTATGPVGVATARPGDRLNAYRRVIGTLAVTETISWGILYYAFVVFQVPIARDLGLSRTTVAGAFSLSLLTAGLTAPLVGRQLDRHGPRTVMTVGSLGGAICVFAWSGVTNAPTLYAVFAGIGAASACVLYEPAFAAVHRWFPDRRRQALLAITVVAGFASTIALPLCTLLIEHLGWRAALRVLALALALTTVIPHLWALRPANADSNALAGPATAAAGPPQTSTVATGRGSRGFWLLTASTVLFTAAVITVTFGLVPYLISQGLSAVAAATASGAFGMLSVAGRLVLTRVAQKFSIARVAAVLLVGQAAGLLLLLVDGIAAIIAFVVLFGAGFGVMTIARPDLLAQHVGPDSYARMSGWQALAATVVKVGGPVAAAAVAQSLGYTALWGSAALCCLLGAACLLPLGRTR